MASNINTLIQFFVYAVLIFIHTMGSNPRAALYSGDHNGNHPPTNVPCLIDNSVMCVHNPNIASQSNGKELTENVIQTLKMLRNKASIHSGFKLDQQFKTDQSQVSQNSLKTYFIDIISLNLPKFCNNLHYSYQSNEGKMTHLPDNSHKGNCAKKKIKGGYSSKNLPKIKATDTYDVLRSSKVDKSHALDFFLMVYSKSSKEIEMDDAFKRNIECRELMLENGKTENKEQSSNYYWNNKPYKLLTKMNMNSHSIVNAEKNCSNNNTTNSSIENGTNAIHLFEPVSSINEVVSLYNKTTAFLQLIQVMTANKISFNFKPYYQSLGETTNELQMYSIPTSPQLQPPYKVFPNKETNEPVLLSLESTEEKPQPDVATNASSGDTKVKESEQLETYSQFAERVSAEKKNGGSPNSKSSSNFAYNSPKVPKVKSKNYASPDCGSKLVAANPEADHAHRIIQSNRDEYLLNKCSDKTWVVVELCESIQPVKFDIANFELFSNLPRDIIVSGSHRFPTRDWIPLGTYHGQEGNRGLQPFAIQTQHFLKFVKIEIMSNYGNEFYCPLSLFRIFGLSEFEVIDHIEEEEEGEEQHGDTVREGDAVKDKPKEKSGMFPNVLKNMMTGVFDVIKRDSRPCHGTNQPQHLVKFTANCQSINDESAVKEEECSIADSINYIISCFSHEYKKFLESNEKLALSFRKVFCEKLYDTMCSTSVNDTIVYKTVCYKSYVCVMLSIKHMMAICHLLHPQIINSTFACYAATNNSATNHSHGNIVGEELHTNAAVATASIADESGGIKAAVVPHQPKELNITNNLRKEENESAQGKDKKNVMQSTVNVNVDKNAHSKDKEKKKNGEKVRDKESKKNENQGIVTSKKNFGLTQNNTATDESQNPGDNTIIPNSPTDNTAPSPSPSQQQTSHTSNLPEQKLPVVSSGNKETIVVRLSNKIKALEENMSISSQYLDELSVRYKRQMEEMQRQFNATIVALNGTAKATYVRDMAHHTQIQELQAHITQISGDLKKVILENQNLATNVVEQHLLLMVVEVVVLCFVFVLCLKRNTTAKCSIISSSNTSVGDVDIEVVEHKGISKRCHRDTKPQSNNVNNHIIYDTQNRRRSIDSSDSLTKARQRQRRPSVEALNIAGTYHDLLIIEPAIAIHVDTAEAKCKKRLKRSMSNSSLGDRVRMKPAEDSQGEEHRKKDRKNRIRTSSAGVLFCGDEGFVVNSTGEYLNGEVCEVGLKDYNSEVNGVQHICNNAEHVWHCNMHTKPNESYSKYHPSYKEDTLIRKEKNKTFYTKNYFSVQDRTNMEYFSNYIHDIESSRNLVRPMNMTVNEIDNYQMNYIHEYSPHFPIEYFVSDTITYSEPSSPTWHSVPLNTDRGSVTKACTMPRKKHSKKKIEYKRKEKCDYTIESPINGGDSLNTSNDAKTNTSTDSMQLSIKKHKISKKKRINQKIYLPVVNKA